MVLAPNSSDGFRDVLDPEKRATRAHVGDEKAEEDGTAPEQEKTAGQIVEHMHISTIGEPEVNRFFVPIYRPGDYSE